VSSGNPSPTFRDKVTLPSWSVKNSKPRRVVLLFLDLLTLEDGTGTLSRNVGEGLPLDAA
jgi:hypothetical protein